jgi:hypothetical protein
VRRASVAPIRLRVHLVDRPLERFGCDLDVAPGRRDQAAAASDVREDAVAPESSCVRFPGVEQLDRIAHPPELQ